MKPKNFPARKERRWVRAWRRLHPDAFLTYQEPPTDIRIRRGAADRAEDNHHRTQP